MIYSLLIILSSLFGPPTKKAHVDVISLEQLQAKTIQPNNDSLYVVNFWATWCKPCVGELPYFEKAGQNFADKKVKILVSLDFLSQKEKVDQFVEKDNIQNEVCLLQAGDPNVWINTIDNNWSGSIPATAIYKNGKKVFFREGDFSTQQELDSVIQTNLK